ncbi:hypothetical protein [Myroides pelagicus]|uniref:Uncharacterized protein n=1 Tax=Myroides pelagicus TaxID=270914 RepID=A0A7K1GHJ5_9FLAO|nr:hypothetical protein [Myroides pelagicus]MTH28396.1 hypothetical protein [Myroides pelagicus]
MIYVKLSIDKAKELGLIEDNHPYPTNGEEVILKKDLLTLANVSVTEEMTELTTAQALKILDTWQI